MTDRYLYNSQNGFIEVIATGRYAEKANALGVNVKYIEITPAPETTPVNWTKFALLSDLCLIKNGYDEPADT